MYLNIYRRIYTMKFYLASGFFNDKQLRDVENIKEVADEVGLDYFSPKDANLCNPMANKENRKKVFDANIEEIKKADFLVVNTRDKDLGTLFEAGYAHAVGLPIIYYCEGLTGGFNLMLSETASCVATSLVSLKLYLENMSKDVKYKHEYVGLIE